MGKRIVLAEEIALQIAEVAKMEDIVTEKEIIGSHGTTSTINLRDVVMIQERRGPKKGERREKMHRIADLRVDQHEG